MSSIEDVTSTVLQAGLSLANEILDGFGDDNMLIVPITIDGVKNYKEAFNELAGKFEKQGINAQIVPVDSQSKLLQQAITGIIKKDAVSLRNVTLSSEVDGVGVFIEFLSPPSAKLIADVRAQVASFLSLFGISKSQIHISSNSHRPTNTEIITTIRTFAPINLTVLLEKMIEQDYDVPALDWLNHKLDNIRKTNLIVKKANGEYALTLKALLDFGSGKDRHSPDVKRFLAMAKGNR